MIKCDFQQLYMTKLTIDMFISDTVYIADLVLTFKDVVTNDHCKIYWLINKLNPISMKCILSYKNWLYGGGRGKWWVGSGDSGEEDRGGTSVDWGKGGMSR